MSTNLCTGDFDNGFDERRDIGAIILCETVVLANRLRLTS
jgi:hypothetical protein